MEGGLRVYKNFHETKTQPITNRPFRLQMPQKVTKSMTTEDSHLHDGFQPGGCFLSPARYAFKDHPSTRRHLTGPRNKLQEKQTGEP